MKKVIYFIAAALMVVSFVSCSDMLDSKSDRYVYDPALDQKVDSMFYINGILKGVQQAIYRAQNEAYKIEKTKKWEKSMNDRELER